MNCLCAYVEPSYDGFTSERIVKAKKQHVCVECGKTINIGEKYEYTFGVWDGEHDVYKTCCDCVSLRSIFFCDGWYYGMMWEMAYEIVREAITDNVMGLDQLDSLTEKTRNKIIDYIDELLVKY